MREGGAYHHGDLGAGSLCLAALAPGMENDISIDETTNKKNLLLLVQLRWIAVVGQVLTIIVVHYGLCIALPVPAMTAVVAFLTGLNLVSLFRYRTQADVSSAALFLELLLDVAALTTQLHLSGGAFNPFVSLYLLQVILGAVLLQAWATWSLVGITSLCFIWLSISYRPIAIPHAHAGELFSLHVQGMFLCFVLAAALLVFFITRINDNLRARDSHLAQLRQQAAEERLVVRMGLLASGAAHELGTPLATMSVLLNDWRRTQTVAADAELSSEMQEMQVQIDRCKSIVSSILASSGEARGEGTVHTTARTLLDNTLVAWRTARSPGKLDYANTFQPDAPIVSDPGLEQVLFNVLDNALEASPAWIGLVAAREDENLVIAISDAGPGFSQDMLDNFGRPYHSTRDRPGSGLGLFLVVNVLRKLGGRAEAHNRPAGGATITLRIPLRRLSAEPIDA